MTRVHIGFKRWRIRGIPVFRGTYSTTEYNAAGERIYYGETIVCPMKRDAKEEALQDALNYARDLAAKRPEPVEIVQSGVAANMPITFAPHN